MVGIDAGFSSTKQLHHATMELAMVPTAKRYGEPSLTLRPSARLCAKPEVVSIEGRRPQIKQGFVATNLM